MLEIIELLRTNPESAFAKIKTLTKDVAKIEEYRKEYKEHDRTIRDTQVGKTQMDKVIQGKPTVKAVRIPINFAKKIVNTSTAFEVGKPVTLIASEDNSLSALVKQIWRTLRIDAIIQQLVMSKKSETQSAIQFYVVDVEQTSLLNKILTKLGLKTQAKEIKVKHLINSKGIMTPVFDEQDSMILFMWEFKTLNIDGKAINNVQVWDKVNRYDYSDASGSMIATETKPHGFDRIPIVYVSQDEPEWFDVKEMIDRLETTLSKLGGSNDYTAYPLLKIFGEIESFPEKEQNGKVLQFPIKVNDEGKEVKGDAQFLESQGASESMELELEKLESFIYSISDTPNLSFDNVKGIGSLSGVAIKLMFMGAIIKASINEGYNRTMIERMINIIISGITNTTNTSLSNEANGLYYEIQFNSVLPDDLKEAVEIASSAVEAGIMSKKTAVEYLGMNEDTDEELGLIEGDREVTETLNTQV
jgi:SPP1 family phage portal protein